MGKLVGVFLILCISALLIKAQLEISLYIARSGTINVNQRTHASLIKDLKCHWDQKFGIPYFCIFENRLWLLVTMPNFNSLRRLEVAFFGRFLSRFYGRHYWPLFRKLACELAEVTLEAHLKPNIIRLLAARNLTAVEKISCQLFAVRP